MASSHEKIITPTTQSDDAYTQSPSNTPTRGFLSSAEWSYFDEKPNQARPLQAQAEDAATADLSVHQAKPTLESIENEQLAAVEQRRLPSEAGEALSAAAEAFTAVDNTSIFDLVVPIGQQFDLYYNLLFFSSIYVVLACLFALVGAEPTQSEHST